MAVVEYLNSPFWLRAVAALAHFVWQGAILAALAMALQFTLRRDGANVRYWALTAVLVLMALCPLTTFLALGPGETAVAAPAKAQPILDMGALTDATERALSSTETPAEPGAPAFEAAPPALEEPAPEPESPATAPAPMPAPIVSEAPLHERLMKTAQAWLTTHTGYVAGAYLLGVAAMLIRLAVGLRGGRRLRRRSKPVCDAAILSALARHARSLGLAVAPAIAYSAHVAAPTIVGVVRPMVLPPLSLASGMPPEQVELLLRHELAHIRRHDHIMNVVQRVIESLLFFHPAVWYVSRAVRIEREHCCDDLVVAEGAAPITYAESLVKAAELGKGVTTPTATALSATGKPSRLRSRITRLLDGRGPRLRLSRVGLVAGLAAVAVTLTAAVHVAASTREKPVGISVDATEPTDGPTHTQELGGVEATLPEGVELAQVTLGKEGDTVEVDIVTREEEEEEEPAPRRTKYDPSNEEHVAISQRIQAGLDSKDWWLRKNAVNEIARVGWEPWDDFLCMKAIVDEDPRVREAAAEAMGQIGAPKFVPYLVSALKEQCPDGVKDPEVVNAYPRACTAAAKALARIDDPAVLELLGKAVNEEYTPMRIGAAEALSAIGSPEAFDLLFVRLPRRRRPALHSAQGHGCVRAACSRGGPGGPERPARRRAAE